MRRGQGGGCQRVRRPRRRRPLPRRADRGVLSPLALDREDPANRRLLDFFAARDGRGRPEIEAGFYPPIERLNVHPDVLEHVWNDLQKDLPADCSRWLRGTAALVHDRSGIVFVFCLGTEYALRLPGPELAEATELGLSPVMRWAGGNRTTDLGEVAGPGWVFSRRRGPEAAWVAAAYRAFG